MPAGPFGIVIDHDTGEDGSEGKGDERELGGDFDEVFEGEVWEEGEGGQNCGNGCQEGKGEDFSGKPGGFETQEEAPGFERFSEVKGGGDHAGVEDDDPNYGCCRTFPEGSGGEAESDLGEGEHEGEGPVGGLGLELGLVGWGCVGGNVASDVAGGWVGDIWGGCAGEEVVFFSKSLGVNFDDGDRFGGAGLDAGRGFAVGEAGVAHVAFSDDAAVVRIFWDVVGAFEDAVFAADALVIEVADDAGVFFFFVSADGAAVEAFGIEAVVAG